MINSRTIRRGMACLGLIFVQIGRSLGVIDDATFSAVVIMVILTTLVTPPLLKWSIGRKRGGGPDGVRSG